VRQLVADNTSLQRTQIVRAGSTSTGKNGLRLVITSRASSASRRCALQSGGLRQHHAPRLRIVSRPRTRSPTVLARRRGSFVDPRDARECRRGVGEARQSLVASSPSLSHCRYTWGRPFRLRRRSPRFSPKWRKRSRPNPRLNTGCRCSRAAPRELTTVSSGGGFISEPVRRRCRRSLPPRRQCQPIVSTVGQVVALATATAARASGN